MDLFTQGQLPISIGEGKAEVEGDRRKVGKESCTEVPGERTLPGSGILVGGRGCPCGPASLQFQEPGKCSECRARLGWATTHLSTLHPEQE